MPGPQDCGQVKGHKQMPVRTSPSSLKTNTEYVLLPPNGNNLQQGKQFIYEVSQTLCSFRNKLRHGPLGTSPADPADLSHLK